MKKLLLAILIPLSISTASFADQYLIDEMESLKSTLGKTDPDRAELSLRLADLYFDVSIQEGEGKNLLFQREKALKLYVDVLEGRDGIPKANVKKSIIIRFQIARVLNKLSRTHEAKNYYLSVYQNENATKKIRREAAFSLAEYYEEEVVFKKADEFYVKALNLCETLESKNYGHYKRAWLHYKEVKLDTAISELKLSLYERDGSVREKVINDLLLFFSAQTTNGEPELAYIRELIIKTGQKDLVRKLVESFYGAGNRIAGSTVLVQLNNEKPDPFYEMRLLEEFYGFRDIDLVKDYLGRLEKRNLFSTPKDKEEAKEFKAMLRRVIVQFDSESESNPAYKDVLKRSIDQYLVFFPNDELRKKMQQGWLGVATDPTEKIKKLHLWINEDLSFGVEASHIRKLRQTRLSMAQKENLPKVVITEATAIADLLTNTDEAREFWYVAAHEQYKAKQYAFALPEFLKLANITNKDHIDIWALQSQNLVLDIYNSQQKYSEMIGQSDSWLKNDTFSSARKYKKDIAEMTLIRKQASFEAVTALGESQAALLSFYQFCFSKTYEKKSCENAKVLAVKLKDQEKLISLLEKAKDEKTLMTEYELMGRFSDAARLQEKFELNRNAPIIAYLKIAVLYEIDEDFKQRDRILKKLISKIRRDKKIDKRFETAIFVTLEQANLLNERALILPWSLGRKISLANRLNIQKPSRLSSKIIHSQKEYAGSVWAKGVLSKVQRLYNRQLKIGFYGRRSKALFKRKVRANEKLARLGKSYLNGSDSITRVYVLDMLKRANQKFGQDILNTPLPEGLTEEIMMQVQANLTQMAAPYLTVGDDYARLQQDELTKIDVPDRVVIEQNILIPTPEYASFIKSEEFSVMFSNQIDFGTIRTQKLVLNKNPLDEKALVNMEAHFKTQKNPRLAAYFTGRINSLKEKND